jgi:hypothetical protein
MWRVGGGGLGLLLYKHSRLVLSTHGFAPIDWTMIPRWFVVEL